MTIVYILIGLAVFHVGLAFFNTISINESFFLSKGSKIKLHLLNWLIPILGAAIVYDKCKNHPVKSSRMGGAIDNPGTFYANSDSGGSDCGGGGE